MFVMDCFNKILEKINKYISRFRVLKIRSNLMLIFILYSAFLLVTLIIYGYSNLANVKAYKKRSEIIEVSQKIRYVASSIRAVKDIQAIESAILKSDMVDYGVFLLSDRIGNILFSTYKAGNEPVNMNRDLLKKLDNTFGVLEDYNSEEGNNYTFYEKVAEDDRILLYMTSEKFFNGNNFYTFNFIVFSSLLCILIYFIIILRFKKGIYNPIINVEKVIHGLVAGDTDFGINSVKEGNILYPLYADLNIMVDKLKDLILREYTSNMMKKQAELDALQSQINPHFLYNTLESIRGQAIAQGMEDIEIMTKALSDLFRYSISEKGNLVSLEEELKNVDNYLMIQQYRFNNKFIIVNKVEADTLNYKIPKLLIQPIVENAIHHGLETKIGKGTITIKAYKTSKRLIVNIQDDGLGISHDKLIEINEVLVKGQANLEFQHSSLRIGLINVNERIKLNFGQDYGLRVYSSIGVGTNVEIVLPHMDK